MAGPVDQVVASPERSAANVERSAQCFPSDFPLEMKCRSGRSDDHRSYGRNPMLAQMVQKAFQSLSTVSEKAGDHGRQVAGVRDA